jgi:hypothetical protein
MVGEKIVERGSRMKKFAMILLLLVILAGIWGCSKATETPVSEPEKEFGFLSGLFDGGFLPFRAVISIFRDDMHIYEPNSATPYLVGFILGIVLLIAAIVSGVLRAFLLGACRGLFTEH